MLKKKFFLECILEWNREELGERKMMGDNITLRKEGTFNICKFDSMSTQVLREGGKALVNAHLTHVCVCAHTHIYI